MRLTKRATQTEPEPEVEISMAGKGRATPKRRESEGRRGPVTAPKTRKEAYARQKQRTKQQRSTGRRAAPRTKAEQRAAMRSGEVLQRRDQGKTRKLARDWVDSKRMLSNYLLILFPLMIASYLIPGASIIVLAIFLIIVVEWFLTGRKIRALATERFGEAEGTTMGIGFYAGSRAYLPRKWRLPGPQVVRGDEI